MDEEKKPAVGSGKKDRTEGAEEQDSRMVKNEIDTPDASVEVNVIDDRDQDVESLIRWGAARAGVLVAAPLIGTGALIANEIYMISRIAGIYRVRLADKAILAFIGSLGGTAAGSLAATLIPIAVMQIPIGISVTYGVGKAAQKWIKDGMPDDVSPYLEVFREEKHKGEEQVEELKKNSQKNQPLGDEKKDFSSAGENEEKSSPGQGHEAAARLADILAQAAETAGDIVVDTLKKLGVKEEKIEDAKYTAIGVSEVARETAQKAVKTLSETAKVKSDEARVKSEELKVQAQQTWEEVKVRAEEMKQAARERAEEARQKAEEMKAQAEEQSGKLKEQAGEAREKAAEAAENAKTAALQVKENFRSAAEDFKAKVAERAEQIKQESQNAKRDHTAAEEKESSGDGKEPVESESENTESDQKPDRKKQSGQDEHGES